MRRPQHRRRGRTKRALALAAQLVFPTARSSFAFMAAFTAYDVLTLLLTSRSLGAASLEGRPLHVLFLLWQGEPEPVVSLHSPLVFPVTWLMGQALFIALIARVLHNAKRGPARHCLLSAGSSTVWWASITMAVLMATLVRLALSLVVCALASATTVGINALVGPNPCMTTATDLPCSLAPHMIACILLPQVMLAQLQALIFMHTGWYWSLMGAAALSAASAVLPGPLLPGDWGMFARNALFALNGIAPEIIEAVSTAVCTTITSIGFARSPSWVEFM